MSPLMRSLSRLYAAGAGLKNDLYDRGVLRPLACGKPVISVGNLTVGGTGKTPIVDYCVGLLERHGRHPGVVCRSYRASACEAGRVDPDLPSVYGDEACWYARRHPRIPVWSGPSKRDTARALVHSEKVDVVVVDDGFQHRGLHRDLDLVLMDATEPFAAYDCLPLGRGRERFEGFERADGVVLTKVNLADPEHVEVLRRRLGDRPVFEFESRLTGVDAEIPERGALFVVSGIARPQSFRALLETLLPGRPLHEMRFVDHHPYSADDAVKIETAAKAKGAVAVLVTEKDEVKLRPHWRSELPLKALSLEVLPRGSVESFYAFLRRTFA